MDGIKNRAQEIIYITVPSMKPQMLFGAVMSIVNAFNMGWIGVALAGANPTPDYSGQLIANHIDDYAFVRYEMGYAAAVSVALLALVWVCSKVANTLFTEKRRILERRIHKWQIFKVTELTQQDFQAARLSFIL